MNYLELEDRLYTSTEVAKILGVSLRSVYRYLEDDKLVAEMKTATGRHRFTKQNILDFLSPQEKKTPKTSEQIKAAVEEVAEKAEEAVEKAEEVVEEVEEVEEEIAKAAQDTKEEKEEEETKETEEEEETKETTEEEVVEEVEKEEVAEKEEEETQEEDEEEVDWLAKFRAAAEKYKTESQDEEVAEKEEVKEEPVKAAPVSGLTDEPIEEKEKKPLSKEHFYTSSVGGLKDIAQNIDKSAKKASLDYAFTMNAGLSLHKPIAPFSLIHAYVRSEDLPFFEKILDLTEASKSDAQLCLIVEDSDSFYNNAEEMHGLSVVSNSQLKKDLIAAGEDALAKEVE